MSKNITIQEGGTGRQLTVGKLKTNMVGGGTCLWLPEDEVPLGTKSINQNGTFKASDNGLYGFSQVTVRGVGVAKGKDPGGSGNDAVATVDPETGKIVVAQVPSSIRVTTPPTNPYGIYQDGQQITTEGMVVKAYLADGSEYGVVPIGEVSIAPDHAIYDPETDDPAAAWADIPGVEDYMPIVLDTEIAYTVTSYGRDVREKMYASPAKFISAYKTWNGGTTGFIRASDEPFQDPDWTLYNYTLDGKTVYYTHWDNMSNRRDVDPVNMKPLPRGETVKKLAWTMIYGNKISAGSRQQIGVTWPRPGDGEILETSFEIAVAPGNAANGD